MHTPGPWSLHVKAGEQHTPTLTGADHYDQDYIAVVGSDGDVVCDNGQYYARPVTLEDARLIASAPDLLSELMCNQGMIEHVTRCVEWLRGNWQQATDSEIMTWTENLMSCVTPREPLNAAAIAKATQP